MKRVLVLDGGGCKGFMQLPVLVALEQRFGRPLPMVFDLVAGTSVGAILGALVAIGMPAQEIANLMADVAPKMFKRRMWPLLPKYDRGDFVDAWVGAVGDVRMGSCRTRYMATSVNMVTGRTHFFKSWEQRDGVEMLLDVVQRSFAAPVYFGGLVDLEHQAVWLDGGTGNENSPMLEAVYEVVDAGWLAERTHILSVGCGHTSTAMSFERASKRWGKTWRELKMYISAEDGGLARRQSIQSRVDLLNRLDGTLEDLTFQRLDVEIPEKLDTLDGVSHAAEYTALGGVLVSQIDWGRLVI